MDIKRYPQLKGRERMRKEWEYQHKRYAAFPYVKGINNKLNREFRKYSTQRVSI